MMIDLITAQVKVADVTLVVINNHVNRELLQTLPKGVRLVLLQRNKSSRWNFWFLLHLWTILAIRRPDIMHCHNDNLIQLFPFFKNRSVFTLHNVGIPVTYLARYKKNIAISDYVLKELQTRYSGSNTTVIINGIDFSQIKRKRQYQLKVGREIRLVQISRLAHEIKAQHIVLQTIKQLNSRAGGVKYSITFIGDGPSQKYLLQVTSNLGIGDFVSFAGYQTRTAIFNSMCEFDILLQPSRTEGFGLTIIEGIAAGLPVIASDIEAPKEILSVFPYNWLFEVDNVDLLIAAIDKVTRHYGDRTIEAMASENLAVAKRRFSIEATNKAHMQLYNEIL